MVDSRKAHATEYFPELLLPVSLSPWWATAEPHLCRIPSNTSRWVWFSLLWGHCSFPLGPDAHTTLYVPSISGVSVSPRPVKVLQSNPASLQSLILWKFLLPLLDPRLGSLAWGSKPSLQWLDFWGIIVPQFVSHPPSGYRVLFYCDSVWLYLYYLQVTLEQQGFELRGFTYTWIFFFNKSIQFYTVCVLISRGLIMGLEHPWLLV